MLTLITGANGAGKSAFVVSQLAELQSREPRPLFVLGIPDLQVLHEQAPPVSEWTRLVPMPEDPSVLEAEFTFPDGSLIVVDEAQKIYRPRAVGSKVPDYVSAIEKHRHKGLDIWLVTQHPQLLDTAVRRLVARHIHVRVHWAGRELLEWSELADPEAAADRARAVRRPFRLPRKAFGLYRSASKHVKVARRVPWAVYVFAVVLVVGGFLGWRFFERVSGAIQGEPTAAVLQAKSSGAPGVGVAVGPSASPGGAGLSLDSFKPRLVGRPESAPLYDEVRKVVAMPGVVGCAATRARCSCYTEQGSDAGLSGDECRAWLRSPPFSPFRHVYPAAPVERPAPAVATPATES